MIENYTGEQNLRTEAQTRLINTGANVPRIAGSLGNFGKNLLQDYYSKNQGRLTEDLDKIMKRNYTD